MNKLSTTTQQLPDTIEDLTQFVLVGKAKLQAYMLKIQTVSKLSVAQEIRDQTLQEAQEISTALIAAEQRIGEILLSIPKATGNQYTSASAEHTAKAKTKAEAISEQGYERHEAHDYQQMAKYPEVVQQVLDNALANGEVVTKNQIMREIKLYKDRIKALESREPEVKTVEIVPEDYEKAKYEAEANRRKMQMYRDECERLTDRYERKCKEALELQDRVNDLEHTTQEGLESANLSENVFYFCAICNNFISNVGGLVWLTERIADMPSKEREMYLKAARAFNDWAVVFRGNLERSLDGTETRTDTGIPLLTD